MIPLTDALGLILAANSRVRSVRSRDPGVGGRAVRRIRVLVTAAASGAVTLAAALFPQLNFAYRVPNIRVAFAAAGLLTVVLTGVLVVGRFLLRPRLTELTLACSLAAFALSELLLITVPAVPEPGWRTAAVWSALAGASVGAGLFALAAFAPRRRLIRRGAALAGSAGLVTAVLGAIVAVLVSFAHLPALPMIPAAHGALVRPALGADTRLLTLELVVAAVYGVAAQGFLRRSGRCDDEFFGWLAVAAILAAAAHINKLLYPTLYSPYFSLGDLFCLGFYVVLLAAAAREIWAYWQAVPEASVLAERQRIARDLHDGLAQELAYLLRHLDSPDRATGQQMKNLLRAARRAQAEARMAISALSSPPMQAVSTTIVRAVGEVAARDGVKLRLDIAPDIQLPAQRCEALVRIACEAVANAARHSGSELVHLSVERDGEHVRLRVRDAGRGFRPYVSPEGFGLISMRERARLVGGDLRVSSSLGEGSEVEALL
jgi:signal transduction histidine kinase